MTEETRKKRKGAIGVRVSGSDAELLKRLADEAELGESAYLGELTRTYLALQRNPEFAGMVYGMILASFQMIQDRKAKNEESS